MVGTALRLFMAATFASVAGSTAWAQSVEPVESTVWFNCNEKNFFLQVLPNFGLPMMSGKVRIPRENLYRLYEAPMADRDDGALRLCHIFDFIYNRVITMHSIARWTSAPSDVRCAGSKNETLEIRLNGKPVARFDAGCESRGSHFQLDYFSDTLTVCHRIGDQKIQWSPECDGGRRDRWLIAPELRSAPR